MGTKRNRRTQEEMLAHYKAKADALAAKIEGRGGDDAGSDLVANLKRRLRKTETALRSAQIMVNGVTKDVHDDLDGQARSAPMSPPLHPQRVTER